MYVQTEYGTVYLIVGAFLVLGILLVCVPRPRKSDFPDPVRDAKLKKLKSKQKAANQAKKDVEKNRKAATKKRKKAAAKK